GGGARRGGRPAGGGGGVGSGPRHDGLKRPRPELDTLDGGLIWTHPLMIRPAIPEVLLPRLAPVRIAGGAGRFSWNAGQPREVFEVTGTRRWRRRRPGSIRRSPRLFPGPPAGPACLS